MKKCPDCGNKELGTFEEYEKNGCVWVCCTQCGFDSGPEKFEEVRQSE